jgi:predicted transcriptional regulator
MEPNSAWSFLSNHAQVLVCIARDKDILLKDVASQIGMTERAVQRIMADLVDGGYVIRKRVGRRNRYEILVNKPIPHSEKVAITVGLALQLFGISIDHESSADSDA